jgi:flavin reductase (DIM6/NTAB) family NADH-FMN oxidoreductase RutF
MKGTPVDAARYRQFMSSFPTGVAVVTTLDADGGPRGLTCSSLASVSLEPPVLSVCLGAWSGTLTALVDHGWFAVNLLGMDGRATAELFAKVSPDHFERTAWRAAEGSGSPILIEHTIAVAACRVVATQTIGDHTVVFGEVVAADREAGRPLLYGLRQFSAWPEAECASA